MISIAGLKSGIASHPVFVSLAQISTVEAVDYSACTVTTMTSFPLEILDHILSLLKKDKTTLILCFKASPLLGAVAERYLYEHISLEMITKPLEQKLQAFLSSHPRASCYVKSITVLFPDSKISQHQAATKRLTETSISWSEIQGIQRETWLKIACLPTLKNLVLRGISDFPFVVLDRCRNLKQVDLLGDIEYKIESPEEAPVLSSAGDQRHLTILNPCFAIRDVSGGLASRIKESAKDALVDAPSISRLSWYKS
ncbi:hypothetical protein CPB83DRAFT_895701 [Crepidotus variabilis]|uniref:Uncharacterized protein n=1 Tax=Crepidotus variabilis TaxID=179855 RepID=A0A9P6JNN7_9AGAR|nr:hypothetical protein CPB83DRAFT_895701 [Crepidotus variabilis]